VRVDFDLCVHLVSGLLRDGLLVVLRLTCLTLNASPPSLAPPPNFQSGSLVFVNFHFFVVSQSSREASTVLKSGCGLRFVASLILRLFFYSFFFISRSIGLDVEEVVVVLVLVLVLVLVGL